MDNLWEESYRLSRNDVTQSLFCEIVLNCYKLNQIQIYFKVMQVFIWERFEITRVEINGDMLRSDKGQNQDRNYRLGQGKKQYLPLSFLLDHRRQGNQATDRSGKTFFLKVLCLLIERSKYIQKSSDEKFYCNKPLYNKHPYSQMYASQLPCVACTYTHHITMRPRSPQIRVCPSHRHEHPLECLHVL